MNSRRELARHPAMAPIVEARNRARAEVRLRSILRESAGARLIRHPRRAGGLELAASDVLELNIDSPPPTAVDR